MSSMKAFKKKLDHLKTIIESMTKYFG